MSGLPSSDSHRPQGARNVGFALGCLWGIAKFAFLFVLLYLELADTWFSAKTLTVLWLSAPHLMVPAGFLMAWLFPEKYFSYTRLLAVGMFLSVATGAATVVQRFQSIVGASLEPQLFGFRTIGVLLLLVVVDLIFLVFLLSSRPLQPDRDTGRTTDESKHAHLPKWDESDVEEA